MKQTENKIAFITGGNRGIGFETARELAEKGVHVIIGSRDLSKGESAASELKTKGLSVEALKFDVNNRTEHKQAADYFEENFGKLDILVNNAGIYLDFYRPGQTGNETSRTSEEMLRKTFDSNFFSLVSLTQTLLPLIKNSSAGRIVNLTSFLGSLTLHSDPTAILYDMKPFAYSSSKAAVNMFTIHLAHELKNTNIKVNSVHPGWVQTEMGGSDATIKVEDGGQTSAQFALLPEDGPTGGFFYLNEIILW